MRERGEVGMEKRVKISKTVRDDIHRPSAIIATEYDFVSFEYLGDFDIYERIQNMKLINDHKARTGGSMSNHEHGGSCHICGAHAVYTAIFYHTQTNAYIRTGLDCAEKMGLVCDGASSFRKNVKKGIEAAKGKRKAQAVLQSLDMSAAWDIYVGEYVEKYEENTICSIVQNLVKYGSISDKQSDFVQKLLRKIADRNKVVDVVSGEYVGTVGARSKFNLTVAFKTAIDTAFGTMYITGMKDASGNTIIHKGSAVFSKVTRGDNVSLMASIKDHAEYKGVKQTIITRPTILA